MSGEAEIGFDEYRDGFRVATAQYLKTGPTLGYWSLTWYALNRVALQYGTDGSARIAHGLTPPGVATVFIQLSRLNEAVLLDGHMTRWHDVAIFPPMTHFTFVSGHHLSWLAVVIPLASQDGTLSADFEALRHLFSRKKLLTLSPSAADSFVEVGQSLRTRLMQSKLREGDPQITESEGAFIEVLEKVLRQHVDAVQLPSEFNESAERIIFRALEYVRARISEAVTVDELVAATGIEYRTLLRAFKRYLNVGPKLYLKLHQLNLIRSALRQEHAADVTVTSVLAGNGVTEFGRFASEYKRLFHETPSETFRQFALDKTGIPYASVDLDGAASLEKH